MRESMVSRSYAEALFELGERHGQRADFETATEELGTLLRENPRVRLFLDSPKVELEQKKEVLRTAFEGRVPPLFLNFVLVVLQKRRQRLLQEIADEYRAILDEALGRVRVNVTLATEPDERSEEDMAAELSRILGRTVIPQVRVDPSIVGGIVVRFGDRVLDASLRRRLLSLRRSMMNVELPGA